MGGYRPTYISGPKTGLVQNRQEMILADDAFPVLENAYVFREQIRRKQGCGFLGRLRRVYTAQALGNLSVTGTFSGNLITIFTLETTAEIQVGSVIVDDGTNVFTDNSLGVLIGVPGGSGTINYATADITITGGINNAPATITFAYYPSLPVMGIRSRDLNPINNEMTVFFDTKYAYNFAASGFVEFLPGTTWSFNLSGANSNFFWTTNYWVDVNNVKIFWATNDSGTSGDPIRYTNGTGNGTGSWIDFAPQIDSSGNLLTQCLAILPFRGRLIAFNTLEGLNLGVSTSYSNRIRWAAIGNPFTAVSAIVTTVNPNAWRDDIRGQGGYLDIPTNEDIIAVGFVRDNLVIYCENSTWQLRYTGRTIAPFQIETVNKELGSGSTFSAIQFDTSLVSIGDKGVVECDSFKSERIDIKIPDLVMNHINTNNNGQKRVHGIRDFELRLAYWTYSETDINSIFPNRILMYNYENDSWAIFNDSFTALGTFQPLSGRTWANSTFPWEEANFSWVNQPQSILAIVGGNQQGWIEYLQVKTTNDPTLNITGITGFTTTSTLITCKNHNLVTGAVIKISNIPTGTPFATSLNGKVYGVVFNDANSFFINLFDVTTQQFSKPQLDSPATYIGGGQFAIRDNFRVVSKKFNFLEEAQNIQIGFVDILMNTTDVGAITLNVYVDYNDSESSNRLPLNQIPGTQTPDTFFNSIIPTSASSFQLQNSTKTNQRVFCPTIGNYISLEYTLSNAQMNGVEQESDLQIDMQILWSRPAGRIGSI